LAVPRRSFMKLFGVSLGSLLLARCQKPAIPTPPPMCYMAVPLTPIGTMPTPKSLAARHRLRLCWLRFDELAQWTGDAGSAREGDSFGGELIAEHRKALDELVAKGVIAAPVADLIHEAYGAAVYHVWRSNAPMSCYDLAYPEYKPASAENLVHQSQVLTQLAAGSTIAPETLAKARTALEHDLAFYALTDADEQALYDRLLAEYSGPGETMPSFEEVELTLTPEVKSAARFLLDILTGK